MKKLSLLLLVFAVPQFAWAQIVMFEAHLRGTQENPPNASTATGFGTATFDLATNFFSYTQTFSGLSANATASHIHRAPVGTNGPIVFHFPITPGQTFGTTGFAGVLTPAQASDLLGGLYYANVHNSIFPGGEIRGQLVAVPEPSTYACGGAALLGLLAIRRLRAKKIAVSV